MQAPIPTGAPIGMRTGIDIPSRISFNPTQVGYRTTVDVSSNGREVLQDDGTRSSSDFEIELPLSLRRRAINSIKLMSVTLPESRRSVRAGTVLPMESSIHLASECTMTVAVSGGSTYTVIIPATLTECELVTSTTYQITGGAMEHGLNDIAWPNDVKLISGEDMGADVSSSGGSDTVFVSDDVSSATAWYLYYPPATPSQIVTALNAAIASKMSADDSTLSITRDIPSGGNLERAERLVRLHLNAGSSNVTLTMSDELSLALLGRTGSFPLTTSEDILSVPKQDSLELPTGSYTATSLLPYVTYASGLSLAGASTLYTLITPTGESVTVNLGRGMYFGTRLAAAVMHAMEDAVSESYPIAVSFSTTTGKFTLSAAAVFDLQFANTAMATALGFLSTRLVGKTSYTSDIASMRHADDLGFILTANYSSVTKQATITPVAPPPVYMPQASTSTTYQTQVKVNGTPEETQHGYKTNDVVVVRKLNTDTEVADVITVVSTDVSALGVDTAKYNVLQFANVSHGFPVSVRLLSSTLRSRVTFNCTATAVASIGASAKHAPAMQLGLNRDITEISGSTLLPRIMNVSDPTTLALRVTLTGATIKGENHVFPSDSVDNSKSKTVFATVQARTQERMVDVSETLRLSDVSGTSGASSIRVRILDARDLKLMEFGEGEVRVAFAFTGPPAPEATYTSRM